MIILQGQNLARTFGGDVLFENINFVIQDTSKVALVGRNGAGKSTLLKILAGEEAPSFGDIAKSSSVRVSYLAQDTGLVSSSTIYDEMLSVFDELRQDEQTLRKMEGQMGELSGTDLELLMKQYDALSEKFRLANGFGYESEIRSVLNGFRFDESMWQRDISTLSGGQKTRLALAKVLLEQPDLLILDEPTNHLDIETLAWLENYLKNYRHALLIVSHDRYFLDKVVNETFELSRGKLEKYHGNYSRYIELKAEKLASEMKQFEKQQKEIASLEDFVNRNIVRASTTKRAQSRRKQLEKMDRLEAPTRDEKSAHFAFKVAKSSGDIVLTASDLAVGYDNETLCYPVNIDERKFDAMAIVGPNGIGKSTLIKTLVGRLPALKGDIRLGANVTIGYYDQEQRDLTNSNTVLEELWSQHRTTPELEIRSRLGAFLFSGDDVTKTVGMLSGGERARLLLAKLSMEEDNFLILDEPTNHLDIDSREVLENALVDFEGSLLFVSHDRYFINRIATKVLELSPEGSKLYLGDYDYYLEKKAEEEELARIAAEEAAAKQPQVVVSTPNDYQQSKEQQREARKVAREIERLENRMDEIDAAINMLHEEMTKTQDFVELGKLNETLQELETEQMEVMEQWETLNT